MNFFNHRRRFAALATIVLSGGLLSAGCGSGGHSSVNPSVSTADASTGAAAALRDVQAGQTALNGLLTQSTAPTTSELQKVVSLFASAHSKNPQNKQASVLYGLMQVAAAAEEVTDATSDAAGSSGKAAYAGSVSGLRLKNLLGRQNPLFQQKTRNALLAAPLFAVQNETTTGTGRAKGRASVDSVRLRAALSHLKDAIGRAIPLVSQGGLDSGFSFELTDFITSSSRPRVMDGADVTAILAALYYAHADLLMVLAYNTDSGAFDFAQTVNDRFAAKNVGDTVTPDEYLPAPPFGTLRSDGKTDFQNAENDLIAGIDTAGIALHYFQDRQGSDLHLVDTAGITKAQYNEAQIALFAFRGALFSPVQIPLDGSGKSVTVNFDAWYNNPPQNIRVLLPTYTVGADAKGEKALLATTASYPDLTFGGLIPHTTGLDALFNHTVQGDQSVGELLSGFLNGLGALGGGL